MPNDGRNAAGARLRLVARDAVRAAKEADRPLSQRQLAELMAVKASHNTKRAGIDTAVADGAIRVEDGARRAVLHVYVRDLTDERDNR